MVLRLPLDPPKLIEIDNDAVRLEPRGSGSVGFSNLTVAIFLEVAVSPPTLPVSEHT